MRDVVTEELDVCGATWIRLRARGAEWSHLTASECYELGVEWVRRYGAEPQGRSLPAHPVPGIGAYRLGPPTVTLAQSDWVSRRSGGALCPEQLARRLKTVIRRFFSSVRVAPHEEGG